MTRTTRLGRTLAIAAFLCIFAGSARAQDHKHDAALLNKALRDVINAGAKIFNEQGDHAGCYRMYQGALVTVKPFLAKDAQRKIDDHLAKAETLMTFADRAFELRKALDEIRGTAKGGMGSQAPISGKVMYQGKPVASGYFVTLIGKADKKYSTAIQKNGSFAFKTAIPPGEYRVAIDPIPGEKAKAALPARYASADTSGLTVSIQAGRQTIDLNLVK